MKERDLKQATYETTDQIVMIESSQKDAGIDTTTVFTRGERNDSF